MYLEELNDLTDIQFVRGIKRAIHEIEDFLPKPAALRRLGTELPTADFQENRESDNRCPRNPQCDGSCDGTGWAPASNTRMSAVKPCVGLATPQVEGDDRRIS